jgi:O-antigen ligase
LGAAPDSLALSLGPTATKRASLSLLPPLAAFLGILSVPRKHFWMLGAAIVFCAFLGFIIGIIQKSRGAASGLFFYLNPGPENFATGTFVNRNSFASQLFSSVPFLAAFAMTWAKRWQIRPILTFAFTLIYIGLLIAVLAAVGSRAGTVFAMVSILLTFLFVFRVGSPNGGRLGTGKSVIALVIGMVIMAQVSMVGILRITATDPLSDARFSIAAVGVEAAKAQFPAGSGMGTFIPVFQLYETPTTIVNAYVNGAHNEWLEVAIEGGAPALILMALFFVWFAYAVFKTVRLAAQDPANAHIRAAAVAAILLMLHAAGDLPFRTDALLTLLGLCFGFLALATAAPALSESAQRRSSGSRGPKSSPKAGPKPASFPPGGGKPGAFRPTSGGFGNRRGAAASPVASPAASPISPEPSEDVNPA